MTQPRRSTAFHIKYILMVWAIITVVFAIALHSTLPVHKFLESEKVLFGVVIPFFISGGLLYSLVGEATEPHQIADKTIHNRDMALVSSKPEIHGAYYPALGIQVTPVFSIPAVINRTVVAVLLPFGFISILLTFDFSAVGLVVIESLVLCWLVFFAINMTNFVRIKRHQAKRYPSVRTVNMMLSTIEIKDLCSRQERPHYKGKSRHRKEIMGALGERAIWAGFLANDLIISGYIDSDNFDSEIKTIEHVINSFIPITINTTADFFKKNKKNKSAAVRRYEKDLEPNIIRQAEKLDSEIWEITKRLKKIEKFALADRKKKRDDLVDIENTLQILTEEYDIPSPTFPEFNELTFNSDQKRVAAKNIVTSSLKTLVEAKDKAKNKIDIDKLDGQINKVKMFVRSLASDTPESEAREARLIEASKADPLHLGTGISGINDIDNTIAIIDRYIDSYDKSLPISKK